MRVKPDPGDRSAIAAVGSVIAVVPFSVRNGRGNESIMGPTADARDQRAPVRCLSDTCEIGRNVPDAATALEPPPQSPTPRARRLNLRA